jgi:hypothetical protein
MAFTKTAGVEYGTPAVVLSTTAASGSNQTAIRTDGQLIAFSTTVPTDISTSTVSASTGDNALASREDHVHGSTAVIVAASQAEVEATSSNTVFVTPGRAQYHPGVAKAWGSVASDGTLGSPDWNIASITKNSTGNYTITWDIDFSTSVYVPIAAMDGDNTTGYDWGTFAVGSLVMNTYLNGSVNDRKFWIAAWGDQ